MKFMTQSQLDGQRAKVARPSIFAGTPSIFESRILKQLDFYSKTTNTYID